MNKLIRYCCTVLSNHVEIRIQEISQNRRACQNKGHSIVFLSYFLFLKIPYSQIRVKGLPYLEHVHSCCYFSSPYQYQSLREHELPHTTPPSRSRLQAIVLQQVLWNHSSGRHRLGAGLCWCYIKCTDGAPLSRRIKVENSSASCVLDENHRDCKYIADVCSATWLIEIQRAN